jgi:phage-related protein
MSRWKVEVIRIAEREIKALSDDLQARFIHVAELLEVLGPHRVSEPHVKPLRGKLWEMRMKGKDGIARAVYFAATGRRLIVIRAFSKKSQRTPNREINLSLQRMKEFLDGEGA